jgi:hypothetical protein
VQFVRTAFVLAGLLGGVSCAKAPQTGIAVHSAFRSFIPRDTTLLAGVRLTELQAAPFYVRHQDRLNFAQLDDLKEKIGLDPRRDLSDLVVAFDGRHVLLLASGTFQSDTVQNKLVTLRAKRLEQKGHTLFLSGNEAVAFPANGLAAAGPVSAVETALDLHASRSGGVSEELQQRLEAIPSGDQLWAATRGGLPVLQLAGNSDVQSALSNIAGYISATSAGLGVDTGLHLRAEIICISDEGARRVRDALRGAIGLGRLTTKDNETDLLRLYDSIQVKQNQRTVRVNSDLPADLADKLLTLGTTTSIFRPH